MIKDARFLMTKKETCNDRFVFSTCTLEKGHDGPHSCDQPSRTIGLLYWWSDLAHGKVGINLAALRNIKVREQ
jgi:hypothetical protein